MRHVLIAVLSLMVGCAMHTTPDEVLETGTRFDRKSARQPVDASRCVAKNANTISQYTTSYRPLDERGGVELLVDWSHGMTHAVIRFKPAAHGAAVTMWIRMYYISRENFDEFVARLIEGC